MGLLSFSLLSSHFSFKRVMRRSLLLSFVLSFSACTNIGFKDLFSDYAEQLKDVRAAQLRGDFNTAATLITEPKMAQNNYTLNLLEKARLHFLANDWAQSRKDFALVSQVLDEDAAKAKLRLSRGVSNVASLVSSDNVVAYQVPFYEQTMLHSYQALNYLFLGELEGALVEIRRANLVQKNALKTNQQELDKGSMTFDKKSLDQVYPSMSAVIGDIRNGFQNAYTFYLSGLLYEAASKPNDAYIDYKRALEIYPNNHYLQQDVLRLATQLGMQDDLALFIANYGTYQAPSIASNGELVILLENGAINPKQEVSIDLPIFSGTNQPRFFSFALPVYDGALARYPALTISLAGQTYTSEQIVRLQSLASKQLQQQMSSVVTRQALRLVAKEKLRDTMSQKGGDIGNILATLYNVASEQADTRSWLTLPDEIQILRLSLPSGKQTIELNLAGKSELIEVNILAKRISLINFTTIGHFQSHKITQL
jgi:hypothetical protein